MSQVHARTVKNPGQVLDCFVGLRGGPQRNDIFQTFPSKVRCNGRRNARAGFFSLRRIPAIPASDYAGGMKQNTARRFASLLAILFAAATTTAAELITNGSFESNLGEGSLPMGWTNQGTGAQTTVQSTGSTVHSGAWSVRVAGRSTGTDGLRHSITASLNAAGSGIHRWCRAYVKVDDFASVRVLLRVTDANGQQPDILVAEQIVRTPGQWVAVEGGSTIIWSGTLVNASIRIEVQQLSRAAVKPAAELPEYFIDGLTLDDDLDDDCILDREEPAAGLDATLQDTDADSLPDRWELDHGFSPAANEAESDTDGDGFSNRQEFWAATDPLDADSYPGKPSNPNANAATRDVLRWLALLPSQSPGRHLASGQHVSDLSTDLTEYPRMIDGLATATGKHPAIVSMAIEPPFDRFGQPLQIAAAESRALEYWQAGGLVMMKWAVYNPWSVLNAGNQTTVDIPGLIDPATSAPGVQAQNQLAHDNLLAWMTQVGDAFERLQQQGVVVMFRPISEMNGGWFWWGHRSYSDYAALWNHLYDYFTTTRGLNNLIWVYESAQTEHAPTFVGAGSNASDYYYPGDDRVDAMCHNFYSADWVLPWDGNRIHARYPKIYGIPQAGPDHANRTGTWDNLTYITRTEAGIPRSSFFIVWNSFDGTDPVTGVPAYRHIGIVDNANAPALMNHPGIVTRDTVPFGATPPGLPTLTTAPLPQTATPGDTVTFTVAAISNTPSTFQWRHNGADIVGATSSSFTISPVLADDAGDYTVVVTNSFGTTTSDAATLTVAPVTNPRLINLSARAFAGDGESTLILGFVIAGEGEKTLLIRGIGPKLLDYDVPGVVADPAVTLYSGRTPITGNDDWDAALSADFAAAGAFALDPGSKDAAMKFTLAPGAYTIHLNNPGPLAEALIEVYDISKDAGTRLSNLSCRLGIAEGETVIIGTYLENAPLPVIVRNIGPELATYDVAGFHLDPALNVFSGDSSIAGNDDWDPSLAANFSAVGAFPLVPGSKDAAIRLALAPGAYTVHATGNGDPGIILVELYESP